MNETATAQSELPDYFSAQVSDARRFYSDKSPEADGALSVVSAGCEHCDADYRISRKTFPYLSVEYVACGKGSLELNKKEYTLEPGTLFAYGPGVGQIIDTDPGDRMVKYFVDFQGACGEHLMSEANIPPGGVIQVSKPDEMTVLFDRLIAEGLNTSRFREQLCAALLEYLLLKIADTAIPYGTRGSRAFYSYIKCQQYIHDNFMDLFSAQQIAEKCLLNNTYICRLFKRFGNCTPYQYLMRLKMNHAAQLLQQPDMLVKEVADELEFADPYHFSRVFKRVYGIPPGQFVNRQPRNGEEA